MKVFGTMEIVPPIEVGIDTVYMRTNITRTERNGITGWEYDEEQISKDEFIANLQQENELLKIEQAQTSTTLLELMEVVLLGGM